MARKPIFHNIKIVFFTAFMVFFVQSAWAVAPDIPTTAQTGRLTEQLLQPTQQNRTNTILPPKKIILDAVIPTDSDGIEIKSVTIDGVTAFPDDEIRALYTPYIGIMANIATLHHLKNRITKLYHDNGYFLSKAVIPEQDITNGTITIQVIEASVADVYIEDAENILNNAPNSVIEDFKNRIKSLKPLHAPTLEKYTLILNDYGIDAKITLLPAKNPDEHKLIDILLQISARQNRANISYDNYGSRYTGPHMISASYTGYGLLNIFDQYSVQSKSSIPFDEVNLYAMSYRTPLLANGLSIHSDLSYVRSAPGYSLKDLEIEGDSTNWSFGVEYPLFKSRKSSLSVGTDFTLQNNFTQFLDQELIDDKVRFLSFIGRYDYNHNDGAQSFVDITFDKGLNILNNTETGSDKASRQKGESDFFLTKLSFNHNRWLNQSLYLRSTISGQITDDPLLSSQEFGYGGIDAGRGYDSSEITGDKGFSSNFELMAPNYVSVSEIDTSFSPFVFYDFGKVWSNKETATNPISASSAGIGFYFIQTDYDISGSVQAAFPLTKKPDTTIMNGNNSPRILMQLSKDF